MPYFSLDGTPDVKVELRIDGPTTFVLLHGFRYVDPDDNGREWKVDDNLVTDLASVPFFLQWLVRSYGKHTKGALIHDQHWDAAHTRVRLHEVNQVFRDAMREDGVPLVRRWLVWSAVSIAGLAKIGAAGWARLVLFVVGLATVMGAAIGAADAEHPLARGLGRVGVACAPRARRSPRRADGRQEQCSSRSRTPGGGDQRGVRVPDLLRRGPFALEGRAGSGRLGTDRGGRRRRVRRLAELARRVRSRRP